jgi:uncharacterized protein
VSSLRINISGLSEGPHSYNLSSPASDLGLDERFDGTVDVSVDLEKTHREILLKAHARCEGVFTCDRCLDVFRRPMEVEYELIYLLTPQEPARKSEEQVEVQVLSHDTNIIDIGEDARQFLLLQLPIKMLCKDDCAGLCPSCGTNLNRGACDCSVTEADPRWNALKNLGKN